MTISLTLKSYNFHQFQRDTVIAFEIAELDIGGRFT